MHKALIRVVSLGFFLLPFRAVAATGDDPTIWPAAQQRLAELTSISASISPTGAVTYKFAGYHPAIKGAVFSGAGGYDPKTGKASERLELPGGKINSLATCNGDPWADYVSCTSPAVTASSGAPVDMALLPYGPPVAAMLLSPGARNRVKAALAEALRNRPTATHTYTPTPTRTPTPRLRAAMLAPTATPTPHLGRAGTLAGGGLAGAVAAPTATRTPVPSGPLYAARYIPQLAGNLKVNEELTLSVRVSNTSGRPWLSGFPAGTFMLSYHWFLGAAAVAPQGLKTPLTTAVPPGGTTPELAVRIKAPSTPGTYTLKWDMVEVVNGSEVWFSSKGVPTFDQTVNVTK